MDAANADLYIIAIRAIALCLSTKQLYTFVCMYVFTIVCIHALNYDGVVPRLICIGNLKYRVLLCCTEQ